MAELPPEIAAMSFEDALAELERIVRALETGATRLDDAINALSQRATPDMIQIQRLKKKKLTLRDEIIRTESKLLPDIIA